MFRQQIETTPLTTDIANEYFRQVSGDKFNYDTTLISTLRALVIPRMKSEDRLNVFVSQIEYNRIEGRDGDDLFSYVFPQYGDKDNFVLTNIIRGSEEEYTEVMDQIEKDMKPGYVRVERATMFFQKVFQLRCYINEELRTTFIITGGIDIQRFHYLQCGILAYLPWYFPEASDLDKELITSMRKRQPDEYLAILQRIADESDMESYRVEKLLTGFQREYYENKMRSVSRDKESAERDIAEYKNRISNLLDRIENFDVQLLGLEAKAASSEGEEELLDYFRAYRKVLRLVGTDGHYITFETRQYLDIYDEDMLEKMLRNKNSYIYMCNDGKYANSDIEKLMRKIFLNKEFRIRFCSAYKLDLRGCVYGLSHYSYDSAIYGTYMPNTHVDEHACLGNYERIIEEILGDGSNDFTAAIDQCLASGRSLNWADSVVTKEFLRYLYKRSTGVNVRCIELPDGRVVDIDGAFEYMEQEKAEEAAKKEDK